MCNLSAQIKALPAVLDQPAVNDELRTLFANDNVRAWLVGLPLAAQDSADLKAALAALNQFDVIDPLNKATMLQAATAGGAIFTTVFSLFGIFSILAGVMLIFLIFVMLAAERRSEMGMAGDWCTARPSGADVCDRRGDLRPGGGVLWGGAGAGHLLFDGRLFWAASSTM
ncbi:MAG: hypothetical protein R2911_40985 [Caldilineaceae bacterium]